MKLSNFVLFQAILDEKKDTFKKKSKICRNSLEMDTPQKLSVKTECKRSVSQSNYSKNTVRNNNSVKKVVFGS